MPILLTAPLGLLSLPVHAQQIGSSVILYDMDSSYEPDHNSVNIAVTTATLTSSESQFWVAIEHAEIVDDFGVEDIASDLLLVWDDGGGVEDTKALPTDRMVQGSGGMYPSLVTWPDEQYVYVVGKQSADQADLNLCGGGGAQTECPHLEFFRQDRDSFASGAVSGGVGVTDDSAVHGRPILTYDYNDAGSPSEKMYVCYTRTQQDTTEDPTPDEDLWEKAKDPSATWGSSNVHIWLDDSPDSGVDHDHCDLEFDESGFRYAVGHRGNFDDIWLDASEWNGSTWTGQFDFDLESPVGVSGINFPTISIDPGSVISNRVVVAEEFPAEDDLLAWICTGDTSACDERGEWPGEAVELEGDVTSPKVVYAGGHIFVAYEDSVAHFVRLASKCNGDPWVDEGALAAPLGADMEVFRFGFANGDSVQEITWDPEDNTIHVVFLGRDNTLQVWQPVMWSEQISEFCP